ncbi:MAG: cytochrome c3 family protein [Acidobacteriota bacterium]
MLLLPWALVLLAGYPLRAQQASVASTLHNLSVSGPGEIKSKTETEVCKFCHIPHSAVVPEPLWSHALSQVGQYGVAKIRRGGGTAEPAPQPDGSSRLCMSCHDGTVALGDIAREEQALPMEGSQRLNPGQNGYLGTDLSGSHPISFEVPDGDQGLRGGARDMGLRPLSAIRSDGQVRLDKKGKMQCTTCHEPHSDQYYRSGRVPHFWVKPSVKEVCLTCHELR